MDQFQDDAEKMALKSMEGLANTKEVRSKVAQVFEDHPIEQEVKECAAQSTKIKE